MINGGYILQPRCIDNSWIASASPVTREIWMYLLRKANHKTVKKGGYEYGIGEVFTSYSQIIKDLSWKVGYRTKSYSESQTKHSMNALRKHLMIDTTKELGGVRIKIVKWDYYQDPKNYERTNERTNEETMNEPMTNQSRPYNNNEKNIRMIKNKYITTDESVELKKKNKKLESHKSEVELKEIVNHFNSVFGKNYRVSDAWRDNANYWLKEFTVDEIKTAITNWQKWGYWTDRGKETLTFLFRTKNATGKCNYIDELFNLKAPYVKSSK